MPFEDNELCPTCHSRVDPENVVRKKGEKTELPANTLVSSNTGEVPQWSDDPCLTELGLNGENFIGRDACRDPHIREIQEARKQEELDVGISEELRTEFTDIDDQQHVRKAHIIELRESTEKILEAVGRTLQEYFNFDPEEVEIAPNPNDPDGDTKEEWTDVQRGLEYINGEGENVTEFKISAGEVKDSPTFPDNTRIRAIHIEDLRHPMPLGWREFWSVSDDNSYNIEENHKGLVNEIVVVVTPSGVVVDTNTLKQDGLADSILDVSGKPFPGQFPNHIQQIVEKTFTRQITPNDERNPPSTDPAFFRTFPSDFDIRPTDGGNRYNHIETLGGDPIVTYPEEGEVPEGEQPQPQRTWILSGFVTYKEHSRNNRRTIFSVPGCPFSLGPAEAGINASSFATAEAEVIDLSESKITQLKPEAKTMELKLHAQADIFPAFLDIKTTSANSNIRVDHIWVLTEGGDPAFNYIIPDDVSAPGNRVIAINKNTHYKFLIDLDGEFSSKSEDMTDVQNNGADGYDFTTVPSGSESESGFFEATEADLVGGSFRGALILFVRQSLPFDVSITFGNNDPGTETIVAQAPFDGQSFIFQKPGSGIFSPNSLTLILGQKARYDEAINIDDLLAAYASISEGAFSYIGHKEEDEETSEIIENPDADKVQFVWTSFRMAASARSTFGATFDGPDDIIGGPPSCDLTLISPNFTVDDLTSTSIDLTALINALRIEGNDKKIGDLE